MHAIMNILHLCINWSFPSFLWSIFFFFKIDPESEKNNNCVMISFRIHVKDKTKIAVFFSIINFLSLQATKSLVSFQCLFIGRTGIQFGLYLCVIVTIKVKARLKMAKDLVDFLKKKWGAFLLWLILISILL